MGFLAWIVVGGIAGWLTGQVMKGGGYGILIDIILGILGGVVGGWIFAPESGPGGTAGSGPQNEVGAWLRLSFPQNYRRCFAHLGLALLQR